MDDQREQRQDDQQQEQLYYSIAGRLHSLVMIGALDVKDFEDVLYAMGILSEWRKHEKR